MYAHYNTYISLFHAALDMYVSQEISRYPSRCGLSNYEGRIMAARSLGGETITTNGHLNVRLPRHWSAGDRLRMGRACCRCCAQGAAREAALFDMRLARSMRSLPSVVAGSGHGDRWAPAPKRTRPVCALSYCASAALRRIMRFSCNDANCKCMPLLCQAMACENCVYSK